MRTIVAGAAVAATFMGLPAYAQSPAEQSSSGQPMGAQEADALRAEVRALRARLEALESRLGSAAPAQAAAAPADDTTPPDPSSPAPPLASSEVGTGAAAGGGKTAKEETAIAWKGSPNFTQGDKAFKVKGRIQADANYVSAPDSLDDQGLGFSTEMRRIRLGGEGKLSSQFSYKLELELSDNAVDLVDTFVTFKDGPWQVQLGNQNAFWSLDELTGDTTGSVMERAAFTDAFNFERRLGIGAQYGKGAWLAQLGVFADDIGALANSSDGPEGGDENNSYSIDGRLVYAPKIGDIQVHVGGSAHWRRLGRLADATTRYRQRPYAHSTNTRLIGTPEMNVSRETMYGAELAAIAGRWHGAAEFYNLTASRVGLPSVSFQGAYAEVGYFLTKGDTRGYKGGIFAGNDPARPLDEGGPGAIQVNLRYDWLDLNDRDIRGGTQNGYIVALIWSPIQYLRFNLNYALLQYTGARALPSGDRSYDANVIGTRFELDF